MTLALSQTANPALLAFPDRLRRSSPALWWTSLIFLAAFAACVGFQVFDARLLNGINVWIKPAKFFLSLAVHMLTLAWSLTLLPGPIGRDRSISIATAIMVTAAIGEMLYIAGRAATGEASHFNLSMPLAGTLYAMMGIGAVAMMAVTAYIGWRVLRDGNRGNLAFATGLGFILAAILTLVTAGALSAHGSHWIGGSQTDATGLPFFGWFTTGGDLRISHFLALHMMQALPIVGLKAGRPLVLAAAAGGIMLTGAFFIQALAGLPLIAL